MNTVERTTGNAYTKDNDYAAFSGKVVNTFTTTHYDPKLKAWIKRTVEYIDVGRQEPVRPCDADELILTKEELEEGKSSKEIRAGFAARERHGRRHAELQQRICAYLIEYGPMHLRAMARDFEIPPNTLQEHLLRREGSVYVRTGKYKNTVLWGVSGIHDKEAA